MTQILICSISTLSIQNDIYIYIYTKFNYNSEINCKDLEEINIYIMFTYETTLISASRCNFT